ncbi:MAG: lysine--tRNA ligase [Flavobacteriales bacterium]|nr:lysine--tRNA ligase [Flavobacteriales bacterium]
MALSEQEEIRRASLARMRDLGIEPYPADEVKVSHHAVDIQNGFSDGDEVKMAGRIMTKRIMGKASFAELMDATGRIQLYFNRDEVCPNEDKSLYNEVFKKLLDIGDFIAIEGTQFRTQTRELSILVKGFKVISKSLRPLPVVKTDADGKVHDAFTDPEGRYRMRYVDLLVNDGVKEIFEKRSRIYSSMRSFFGEHGYMEVETPILQPIPGGAAARPFITHHNALDMQQYMRIACELYLKKLIVGGFDGVYEFAKTFRNEGLDRTHNPEFTMMEIYVTYKDYNWMMDFTEAMLKRVCKDVLNGYRTKVGENEIDFEPKFRRLTMRDAIMEYAEFDIKEKSEEELVAFCKQNDIEIDDTMGRGKLIDEIFGEKCEPHLIQPTFIIDYPIEMSPLCKVHRDDPTLTERFELIVNGKELANAYSELNDPIDQRARFEEQLKLADRGDDEAMFIDHDFLRALEYGMPPTSGMGIGIDRLVMLLTGQTSIQEVLFFPQMRPEKKDQKPVAELNENEKLVISFLEKESPIDLRKLKELSALSNKQWDKTIKGLRGHGLVSVEKNEEGLKVEMV